MSTPSAALRDLITEPLANGRSVKDQPGGFPVLRLTALRNGTIDLHQRKEGAWSRADAERFLVRAGDFLVSRGSGSLDLVGRGGLVAVDPDEVAFPDTMIRVRPDAARVEPRFLALAWSSPSIRRQIESCARTTAGIYKVNQTDLGAVAVPLPPLEEQRRIVDVLEDHLSRLDAASDYLAASRRRLVALERSALDAQFGGEDVSLADLIEDISAGKSFGAANAPARADEWGIIKVSAMTWGEFDPAENKAVTDEGRVDPRFEIHPGDLLVSRANTSELVGASVLVRDTRAKLLLSDKSLRLKPRSEVNAEWLWRALQAPSVRRQISVLATGTKDSMRNISQAALKRVLLPNVSSDEQAAALQSFSEVADAIAVLRREIATGAQRLETLRRSLLAAAFSGRLTGDAADLSEANEMINA